MKDGTDTSTDQPRRVVLITGPSGAGMSTASDALEDAGFEAIDNLPLRLVSPLLEDPGQGQPMSLGLDTRNRDFSAQGILDLLATLESHPGIDAQLLYLDCSIDEILRRYSGTRRRHPIRQAASLVDGIAAEIALLQPVRERADVLIDTSEMNPHQLRAEVEKWFVPGGARHVMIQLQSFSYKRGLPRSVDLVFDCRFLKNPFWEPRLRPMDGRMREVQEYVASDPRYAEFFDRLQGFAQFLLPAVRDEGKSYLSIAFGCTGGQHRSVALAESLSQALAEQGWQVSIRHRELDRRQSEEAPH